VAKKRRPAELTCFLNVDLDLAAAQDLAPLVRELGPRAFDLHTGPGGAGYQTHLELNSRGAEKQRNADATIRQFVKLLATLPSREKRLWNDATQRDFNIGIQSGMEPRAFELALQPETLKAVARLGARVVVTVYAVDAVPRRQARRRGKRPGR
jgi:hypothetical protein